MGTLVSLAIVMSVGLLLLESMSRFKLKEGQLDRLRDGTQVLVNEASVALGRPFNEILTLCSTSYVGGPGAGSLPGQGHFVTSPIPLGPCVQSTGLALTTDAAQTNCSGRPGEFLDFRRSWTGDCDSNGPVCVQLGRCTWKAQGHILEFELTGWFVDSIPNSLLRRDLVLRRSQW